MCFIVCMFIQSGKYSGTTPLKIIIIICRDTMQSSLYLLFEPYSLAAESRLLDLSSNIQGFLAEFKLGKLVVLKAVGVSDQTKN